MREALPRKRWAWPVALLVGGCALFGAMPTAAVAADNFDPVVVNVTLGAGESITINKTLHLDAAPEFADIILAIDTTGSMGTAIAQAQAEATQICDDVKAEIPGARFAVVDFRDYPFAPYGFGGSFVEYAYLLRTPGFVADCATVDAAIGLMAASGGGDTPESYNRVFFEAYSDPALVYNPQAVKLLVVLGDAPPHDPTQTVAPACGNQPPVDPGRDNVAGTPDDLETEATIAGLNANDITLLMIRYATGGVGLACYEQLAGATGGDAVEAGGAGTLSTIIVDLVREEAAHIDQVNLVVSASCPLGITFNPPPPYGPFTAPVDILFQETITAPTVPGGYICTVTAVVDGAQRAVQTIDATVTAGPAASLELEPAAHTNTVDDEHCVTAQVEDQFGNPNPDVTVRFSVTPTVGRSPSSGSSVTNVSGRALFCYTSALPGSDIINAYADLNNNTVQDPGEPFDAAAKLWEVPASTEGCKVTYGGRITAANGDKATFGGNAQVKKNGTLHGQEEYQDHGPALDMNVHSINVLAISCPDTSPLEASIFGTATIDGSGSVDYRIDVKDVDEPGAASDTYRIRLGNGYDSGEQVIRSGNIQIHK